MLSENIKRLRKSKRLTQKDLAEMLGIAPTAVSAWESGRNKPLMNNIEKMSRIFDVKKSELIGENHYIANDITVIYNQLDDPRKMKVYSFAENELEKQNRPKLIRVYGQTAAGEPIEYGDEIIEEKEVLYVPDGADCALHIKGDSMEPEFEDGSVVFYKKQPILENGEIGIFEIDGGVTMKKYKVDYDNQKIHLVSLNKKYDDMIFDEVDIIGKVIK